MNRFTTLLFFLGLFCEAIAQPSFTANDQVTPYAGPFAYGANLNYYPGWTDLTVADISFGKPSQGLPGIGLNAFRGSLPEHFLEAWSYDIRVDYYEYYESLGASDQLVFIGYPTDAHRDHTEYCPGTQSTLFANLYEPIWDGGANGTPYNDANYYARYVYKMVNEYKDFVRFWEVWNEPDFAWNTLVSFAEPGTPGNWWENNPPPCDQAMAAPIFHYIRMLRITWEVVKTLDPDAYVCVGGLGNPAFLDAICRNTDNPDNGSPTPNYPLQGGAYFDVLSIHSYPHFDGSLRHWENPVGWVYHRHSDRAVEGMVSRFASMQNVLANYGYDGSSFPRKLKLLSETNLPRKSFNAEYLGSAEAQRNYVIKAMVEAQRQQVEQAYLYLIADPVLEQNSVYEFQTMGLFKNLGAYTYPNYEVNEVAIGLKTTSDFLHGKHYDLALTNALALPPNIGGAAFSSKSDTIYVLWAKTQTDLSEAASATYAFPATQNNDSVEVQGWDYSQQPISDFHPATEIPLTGAPVFLHYKPGRPEVIESVSDSRSKGHFSLFPNPTNGLVQCRFEHFRPGNYELTVCDLMGRQVLAQRLDIQGDKAAVSIDLKAVAKGVYCVKLQAESGFMAKRLVVD
ncbi:MAG: T9SS type A sorting domain-containing protein [Saprospiraceae bacterium]|nr:T9SS type A sorting domain-containing protein [Saprospiraceae bacterium]